MSKILPEEKLEAIASNLGTFFNKVFTSIEVTGRDFSIDTLNENPTIICATHRSQTDWFMLGQNFIGYGGKKLRFGAGDNLTQLPLLGPRLQSYGAFTIERDKANHRSYLTTLCLKVVEMLEDNATIIVFPEGGRSYSGRLMELKAGIIGAGCIFKSRHPEKPVYYAPVGITYECLPELLQFSTLQKGKLARSGKNGILQRLKGNGYYFGADLLAFSKFWAAPSFGTTYGKVFIDYGKPVEISEYIDPFLGLQESARDEFLGDSMVVDIDGVEKKEAVRELISKTCKKLGLRKVKSLMDEFDRREDASSTFIGQSIAIPQTRGPIKSKFAISVGRSHMGVNYDAARGARARILVLVIASDDLESAEFVSLLAEVASFFKNEDIKQRILAVDGPVDIRAVIESVRKTTGESRTPRKVKKSVPPIFSAAITLARETKAAAIMVFADTVRENTFLDYFKYRSKLILVSSTKTRFESLERPVKGIIQAPSSPSSRTGHIRIGIMLAMSRNLLQRDDTVVCVSGNAQTGIFDTIITLDVASEYEFFFTRTISIFPKDVKPEVLERVLGIACEIAVEGREGKPTGTIFVIGDTNSVQAHVRQLIINPFRGYSEAERKILDPGLDETIKEFAAIDGAFVITGDGIVLSAGSYLRPSVEAVEDLPSGFGSRHEAAAAITACTNALAITISESTGLVTLFKDGAILMTLSKPVVQAKGTIHKVL